MSQRPEPPPEGALIKAALKRSGKSARKAASEAGISEGRWRQIVAGYQSAGAGNFVPVRGPAETVARMAQVAGGISPEDLEAAQRPDAAEKLRHLVEPSDDPIDLYTYVPKTAAEKVMLEIWQATRRERQLIEERLDQFDEKLDRLAREGDDGDGQARSA